MKFRKIKTFSVLWTGGSGMYSVVTWYTGVQGHGIQFCVKIEASKTL